MYSLEVFVDIHGHSASRSGFLFCNPPLDPSPAPLARSNRYALTKHVLSSNLVCLSQETCNNIV